MSIYLVRLTVLVQVIRSFDFMYLISLNMILFIVSTTQKFNEFDSVGARFGFADFYALYVLWVLSKTVLLFVWFVCICLSDAFPHISRRWKIVSMVSYVLFQALNWLFDVVLFSTLLRPVKLCLQAAIPLSCFNTQSSSASTLFAQCFYMSRYCTARVPVCFTHIV
jgi:hypothetical protein